MRLLAVALTLGLLLLYTNCDGYSRQDVPSMGFQLGDPTNVNSWKEVPPSLICGKAGWDFMRRNYITQNCSACHYSGGFVSPSFADANSDIAYNGAKQVLKARWVETTTHNQFCGPGCNLSTTGQVFQGLMQWYDNQYGCP